MLPSCKEQSTAKMALCQAITQNGFRPCANKARHGHDTCASHKNFFQKRNWFQKFILGENKSRDFVLLGYAEDTPTHRLEQHVRHTLESGRVEITEEDIRRMPAVASMVDVFLILCQLPTVDPNWNKRLVLEAIRYHFMLLLDHFNGHRDYNPYLIQRERIGPFLNNPHMGFARTLKFMMKTKQMRDKTRHLLQEVGASPYEELFATLFLDYTNDYTWYSTEALTALMVPEGCKADYFQANIIPRLKRRAHQLKHAKKMHMDPLKEEIVAKVYHPRNVQRWLQLGEAEGDEWKIVDMMF